MKSSPTTSRRPATHRGFALAALLAACLGAGASAASAHEITNHEGVSFAHIHDLQRAPQQLGSVPRHSGYNLLYKIKEVHLNERQDISGADELSVRLRANGPFNGKYTNCFDTKSDGTCLGFPYMNEIAPGETQYPGSRPNLVLADITDLDADIALDVTGWDDDGDSNCDYTAGNYNQCVDYDSSYDDGYGTAAIGSYSVNDVLAAGKVTATRDLGDYVTVKVEITAKPASTARFSCEYGVCFRFPTNNDKIYKPWIDNNPLGLQGPYFMDHASQQGDDWDVADDDGFWQWVDDIENWDCENYLGRSVGTSGNGECYDGHKGSDYMLEGEKWENMEAKVPVYAAARGRVIAIQDGLWDRCESGSEDEEGKSTIDCGKTSDGHQRPEKANFVEVSTRGSDGAEVKHRYFHLMTNEIKVTSGDWVECGELLGYIGSSGISSAPHLHFEVHVKPAGGSWVVTDPNFWSAAYHDDEEAAGGVHRSKSMWTSHPYPDQLPAETCQDPYELSTGEYIAEPTGFSLGMGDFNGNGVADVFYAGGESGWWVSDEGTGALRQLKTGAFTGSPLRSYYLADFDADGKTDVFFATGSSWWIAYSGTSWVKVRADVTKTLDQLGFGDFNGDGILDILWATESTSSGWMWWHGNGTRDSAAFSGYYALYSGTYTGFKASDYLFADFDRDGITDVFYAGSENWWIAYSGKTWVKVLADVYVRRSDLAVGQFYGSSAPDILWMPGEDQDFGWKLFAGTGTRDTGAGFSAQRAWKTGSGTDLRRSQYGLGRFLTTSTDDVFRATGSTWYAAKKGYYDWTVLQNSSVR
ncbi:MAG: VCBS repeat domain-containing M23 family metallopeptidase [Candidatus Schekmanbacteria bacterium]|nr:VCBS repeat domain-containing M23 family metallopeptidase [Candidatus Schekmanbacteria bacterium]